MIQLACTVPHRIDLAFSGGVDSLVAAHFFKQGKRDVRLLHYNHGCQYSDAIMHQCIDLAEQLGLPLEIGRATGAAPAPGESLEAFWRRGRYAFLGGYGNTPVVTCHHLDDAVETWVWSALHGAPKVIPVQRGKYIRPFVLTEKVTLERYASDHGLVPVPDPYNEDHTLIRNYIRKYLIPHALYVNPGLKKVVRKKYLQNA